GRLMGLIELFDGGDFRPSLGLFGGDDGFEDRDAFCAVEEVGMHFGIGRDGIDEIENSMDERMFVPDNMSWRPPGAEIRMSIMSAKDRLEAGLVGRITAIAVF